MELLNPNVGLVFWMMISFLILLFVLTKFAWKPIVNAIKKREEYISKALNAAADAEKRMQLLKSENENLLILARKERDEILKEAREVRERIIADAKNRAQQEADRLVSIARENIHNSKMKAMTDLRNQVAQLSFEIAEKILKEKLSDDAKQKEAVGKILKEVTLN